MIRIKSQQNEVKENLKWEKKFNINCLIILEAIN